MIKILVIGCWNWSPYV